MTGSPRAAPAVATLLLAAALAGCIVGDPGALDLDVDPPTLDDAWAALLAGSPAANVERIADLGVGPGQELDAWGDYVAIMQNFQSVILVDVGDPHHPDVVGRIDLTRVLDVKWSHDGQWLFVGNDDRGQVRGVTDDVNDGGFYVVDASDKENPRLHSFYPQGPERGPHMVGYHRMPDGTEIVTGANADISIQRFDRDTGTLTEIGRYRPDLVTGYDRTPERLNAYYGVQGWAHDMFIQDEPDGRTFMYVANWDAGLRIVDITDPARPTEVGAWVDWPDGHTGNLHTVATQWVGDRRITVGAPELGFLLVGGLHWAMGTERTGVYVWDTTDPARIELLSHWSHPEDACRYAGRDHIPDEEITSSHNLQIEAGRVYLAHFACGVYILDVGTPELQRDPQLLAFDRGSDLASTWDVVLHRGLMYYGDEGGVVSARFLLDTPGPDGLSSRA